jgi:16S rRNA G966 N2-methylase RsmD
MKIKRRKIKQSTFFEEVDIFKTLKTRLGIWPVTVWEINYAEPLNLRLKKAIDDGGEGRRECFTKSGFDCGKRKIGNVYAGAITESIFSPQLATLIMNCFAPSKGICFDPFCGGGTRAIVVAKHGLDYIGLEIRKEEVSAVVKRCSKNGVADKVKILLGDACAASDKVKRNCADILFTCPPYWNLEKYDGGSKDLSMTSTYKKYLLKIKKVIVESHKILKKDALSVWVVGLHRKGEALLPINHDVATLHRENGFILKEEIIINLKNTGAMQRVGNFEKGNKFLIRTHEYVLVFKKVAK